MRSQIKRAMPHLTSRGHLSSCQRCCTEERSGRKDGEEMEGGEKGTMDGQPQGTGLGQEWKMPLLVLSLDVWPSYEA